MALIEAMQRAAEKQYLATLARDIGEGYSQPLIALLELVHQVHTALSTERLSGSVSVCIAVDAGATVFDVPGLHITDATHLTALHRTGEPLTVELLADRSLQVGRFVPPPQSKGMLVYRYRAPGNETFETATSTSPVPDAPGFSSYFAVPYFRVLREALLRYSSDFVRYSQCDVLGTSWYARTRLAFLAGPEHLMRRSMQNYLRASLRDHQGVSIMPEQNVDETKPVDIKVTFSQGNRVALIEIKWLGKSARAGEDEFTQKFYAGRAVEGAKQLADYLDRYHAEVPHEEVRGYLAVYDARRRNLGKPSSQISREDALAYELAEIDYSGTRALERDDFEQPIRFFCVPAV